MNADASGDLARVAAGLRQEIRSKVDGLRRQLTDELKRLDRTVERRARETAARLDAVDARLDTLAADQAVLRQHVERRLRDVAQRTGRLEGEIQQIEGLLRHQQGHVPVDLDGVPADLRVLVDDVRAAERIRAGLLDDDARAARRRDIERCEQDEHTLAETRQRALSASRALAVRTAGGWAFRRAVLAYRSERSRMSELEAQLAAAREKRAQAEQELRHDAAQQQAFRAHPGADAADRLAGRVRDRIDDAVAEYHLFPPWFVTVLGHRPAPTRAAQWREAAVQVVLYRITFEVTDRLLALGPPPSGGHRLVRYDAVQAALRGLEE
ncbi:hypothetical protein GCM10020358_38880 [Amorphoplanes nipponensis]|uniref:Uncharacterized protein n=1 Tax=Actinoplanes nipponensis TaxID=135950 RepID=A0A919JFD8_9ACTN|nr:hypothetical protein [Actinoplanes nipponensis]GIE48315.1 hypothetical protein Ani05nite_18490 [Actinoplanes nipponensis]